MPDLVAPRSLAADAERLRTGEQDPIEYLDALVERIGRSEDELHAYVTAYDEPDGGPGRGAALAQLERVRERWPDGSERPPLYGVPVAVKDIFAADGYATTAGSKLPTDAFADHEATVVRRLREAGAVVLGKSVTAEFASFAPGPTRNPHDPEHTPGGSSSGSAAAVASGTAPLALGTQTVGSMTRPAAYCGIVGSTPTFGRIPGDGMIANAPSFDTIGWFAADMASIALAAAYLVDDWHRVEVGRLPVIGMPEGAYLEQASEDARAAYAAAAERLRAHGCELRTATPWPDFEEVRERHRLVNRFEMAHVHRRWFDTYRHLYHPVTVEYVEAGRAIDEETYTAARAARLDFRAAVEARMEADEIDVWLAPAATGAAPAGLETTGDPAMSLPWTHYGGPVLSLPVTTDAAGLPLGVQLVGRRGEDERLIAWGERLAEVVRA